VKLFGAPLPEDAIKEIEDLLKVVKLDDKPSAPVKKGKKKAAVVPA
jgi:hypothetical protein